MVSYGNTMLTDFHFVKFHVITHIIKYKTEACPKHKTRWVQKWRGFWRYESFKVLTHSHTPRLYGPLTALAFLTMNAHSSLSNAFYPYLLTFISCRSFSTSSSHLKLGLPILLLSSSWLSNTFLTALPWSILMIHPTESKLFFKVLLLPNLRSDYKVSATHCSKDFIWN